MAQTCPQFLVTPANDLEVGMLTHVYEGRVCFRAGVSHAFAYCTNAWRWALELHVTLWSFLGPYDLFRIVIQNTISGCPVSTPLQGAACADLSLLKLTVCLWVGE